MSTDEKGVFIQIQNIVSSKALVLVNCLNTFVDDWRYEISLLVLKNISRECTPVNNCNVFQHQKRNFVSPSEHVIFFYYILI